MACRCFQSPNESWLLNTKLSKMLTTKQAGSRLDLDPRTIKRYCREGKLKCEKIGRDWLIPEAEIERYERERKPKGRPRAIRRLIDTAKQERRP